MKIHCQYSQLVKISELKPHPKNRNDHPDDQIDRLGEILKYQGWRYPVKVSNQSGYITSGHGRVMAAKKMGLTEVPVSFQDYEDEAQEYADIIADNAIASWSELNLSAINDDVPDLGPDFNIDLLGIKDFVLEPAEKLDPQCDEDEVPEASLNPKVVRGEIYSLGNHRLMCGDSTVITDVERLMNGKRSNICFTSPPYNAGSLNISSNEGTKKKYNEFNDNKSEDEFFDFIASNLNCIFSVSDEVLYNIGLVENNKRVIIRILNAYIEKFKDIIYWKKTSVAPHIQPGVINNLVEFILCFGNGKRKFLTPQFNQGTYFNVIEGKNASGNEFAKIHKATFPIYLSENIIENFCPKNGAVLDTFGGTGTTLIACEKTNRTGYLMEIDPIYCGVMLDRWQKFTGKKAYREDGVSWDDIKAEIKNG